MNKKILFSIFAMIVCVGLGTSPITETALAQSGGQTIATPDGPFHYYDLYLENDEKPESDGFLSEGGMALQLLRVKTSVSDEWVHVKNIERLDIASSDSGIDLPSVILYLTGGEKVRGAAGFSFLTDSGRVVEFGCRLEKGKKFKLVKTRVRTDLTL